jgi:hypothetical protein
MILKILRFEYKTTETTQTMIPFSALMIAHHLKTGRLPPMLWSQLTELREKIKGRRK